MRLRSLALITSWLFLLAGCQSVPSGPVTSKQPLPSRIETAPDAATVPVAENLPPADLWERMRRDFTWGIRYEQRSKDARRHFLRQNDYMGVVAGRGKLFLHYIVEELDRRNMPQELALLPMVESAFDPFAHSSQSASGLWQIIPSTGKYLGLEQDWWYDGRLDLRDSTRAALDYLEELHRYFEGDWLLAVAAYNGGKSRVRRAQRRNQKNGKATDFWSLRLPRETRGYVPRLLALATIVSNPDRYGVTLPSIPNEPVIEVVDIGGQIEMRRAADLAAIPLLDLRMLNAGHRRWATAPTRPPELLLPLGSGGRLRQKLASLPPEERLPWQYYRIRRGDSLSQIARNFNTSVDVLRQANGIRGNLIRAGDKLMIPAGPDWPRNVAQADGGRKAQGYRVRRGDSLHRIAGKFNVSVSDIVAWNSLDPKKYLQPGQQLTLYLSDG